MLVIDSREYGPLKARALAAIPESQVEFLHAGDYLLFDQDGHSIGIERKEIKDLLGSLAQGKLKRQLQSLAQYDRGILLIEGHWLVARDGTLTVHNKRSAWQPASIQAILLALQEQTGAKVLHTANYDETLLTLRMLNKRGEKGCFWPKDKDDEQAPRAA
jgi:ERCC4-type nuclease